MAKLNTADVIASLKEMTILELNELVKAIEEEFGVTAAAPVAVAAAADAAPAGPVEVTVTLTNDGGAKIPVIKVVREITGLGLKEAKELVDNTPSVIKANVTPEEGEAIKAKLVEAGASVEVK